MLRASVDATEADDTVYSVGVSPLRATSATTDHATLSATATLAITASSIMWEEGDSLASQGSLKVMGASYSEDSDSLTSTAALKLTATSATTDRR